MKYLALLATVAVIYFILAREMPIETVKDAIVQTELAPLTQGGRAVAPGGNSALKRPLDRTHDALERVKARNGTDED